MKHIYIVLIATFAVCCISHQIRAEEELWLKELDKVIAQKKRYHQDKEARITNLRDSLSLSIDATQKYGVMSELAQSYLHYQADSSLAYIRRMEQLLSEMDSIEQRQADLIILRSSVMGVMGMYIEAIDLLKTVHASVLSHSRRIAYYQAFRTCYGWLADYTPNIEDKVKYRKQTDAYRDSVIMCNPPEPGLSIALAEQHIQRKENIKAIELLRNALYTANNDVDKIFIYYTLSEAYSGIGNSKVSIEYLAQTAIIDLQHAVREYASLQKLAYMVYQKGDIARAYNYLSCSMEDAVACNARLRFMEVTEFYPIIDKAYELQKREEQRYFYLMLGCVTLLSLLLLVALAYLYRWMKKLSAMRKSLSVANKELKSVNSELEQAGKIKEVYIAKYLDRCVNYINKLEQYRRSLVKIAKTSSVEELHKALKAEQFIRDEREQFYVEFDKSFLKLFPHFVESFNDLLLPDEKIIPTQPERTLTPELRIFALIRLGVSDSQRIAHFLGYSVATIYNYRSRIRNKAKGNKGEFEEQVMRL